MLTAECIAAIEAGPERMDGDLADLRNEDQVRVDTIARLQAELVDIRARIAALDGHVSALKKVAVGKGGTEK